MTAPGPIALRAVEVAEVEARRGVTEHGGNNRGPEVDAYLAAVGVPPGMPWCTAFVRWCLERAAGRPDLPDGFPDSGWTPAIQAWATKRGAWIPAYGCMSRVGADLPQRGDIALFFFAAMSRVAHSGMVTGDLSPTGGFLCVEGNTSNPRGSLDVDRDGAGVYIKPRTLSAVGKSGGFVRLPW